MVCNLGDGNATSLGFPSGSNGKEDACNVEGSGSIPGSGRSPGKGTGKQPTPMLPGESQEPGRLQSMGSIRVRHDGKTNPHTHTLGILGYHGT